MSYVCIISNCIVLATTLWIITVDQNTIDNPVFQGKWSPLIEDFKIDKWSRTSTFIFCLRRTILFCIIFILIDSGGLQTVAFGISNLVIFSFNGAIQAKKTRAANNWMLAEEFMLCIISSLIFCFTDFVSVSETRYIVGWILCFVLSAYILVTIVIQAIDLIKHLIHRYRKYKNYKAWLQK